ncbi:MAG: choice-of-anchor D domain-containing protein, partial [Chitinophagaceae bacterium]|nr:choice-of-anchor D domain-containing protein [Chitinophagaceae bacterium]
MKKFLLTSSCVAVAALANAQTTGPSSSETPYLVPVANGVKITSILTVGDEVNGYKMAGTPDGMGAFDNGDGTFTLLMNHEFGNTAGTVRAHGSTGSFVSKWIIKKDVNDLKVLNGSDLMQRVKLWESNKYNTYYSSNPSTNAAFARFCSADLAAVSAYYNSKTGKGTMDRIFTDGEESGTEGRPMGHIVTGPEAGTSYELTYLAKMAYENVVACPYEQDKTIVGLTDDGTGGQVYFYIGEKKSSGNTIEKAGLTGGKVYGVAVSGYASESNGNLPVSDTTFTLVDMGTTVGINGSAFNTSSVNAGVTSFLRPEDGCWDPRNPNIFYFVTTNSFSSPSRLWKLEFADITDPAKGGKINAVMDGTEGQKMMDNITIDNWGHLLIVEDVGNNAHIGRILQYSIAGDSMNVLAEHDNTRFLSGGANYLTQDEECSGIFDAQHILGSGWFLAVDQAHYSKGGELVEGGQLIAVFNPASANANPEISIEGNSTNIPAGANNPQTSDNTDFGTTATGTTVTKTFELKNAGPADLMIDTIMVAGANANEFAASGITFPATIAANSSKTLTVKFAPTAVGLRKADITVSSNDFDESKFNFTVQGVGLNPADVENTSLSQFVKLYPNPTRDMATVAINLNEPKTVSVTVVSMNGKLVAATIQQQLGAGEQKVNVSTADLPNGNYFVVISAGEEITKIQLV